MLSADERAQAIERLISHQQRRVEAAQYAVKEAKAIRKEGHKIDAKSILTYRRLVVRCRVNELRALRGVRRRT